MARLDPRELYELATDLPVLDEPVMVQALDGFIDAGSARRLARQQLQQAGESRRLATFDVDQLFDYRARRPTMLFVEDHWESYDAPELTLDLLTDTAGTPFLLLSGPEPDVQWERFVEAARQLIDLFGVRLTVGLGAIPMGVPHTRPAGVIAHGSSKELLAGYEPWLDSVQVPASVGHLLEHRLGQAGLDAVGFAVHVPHYVAGTDYPAAAAALLGEVGRLADLVLPVGDLEAAAAATRQAIDEQVAGADEVAAVVTALEEQYDAYVEGRGSGLLAGGPRPLPSADELGAELERFLAQQDPPSL